MSFLNRLSLKAKFTLMLFVPLAGLVWFGIHGLLDKRATSLNMESMAGLSTLAVRISALVHETQKERGMTAGFLGSEGKKFSSELPRQRRDNTDPRAVELRVFLKKFKAQDYGRELSATLSEAVRNLDGLAAVRRQVDGLSIPTGQAIGHYTRMNGLFLDSIGRIATLAKNARMTALGNAYAYFLLGKERAGIERAVLTNTFARDSFGEGMFRQFITLVAEQDTFTRVFLDFATAEQGAFYEEKLSGPTIDAVNQMRGVASEKGGAGGFGINPNVWFQTITTKINLLKEIEDRLSHDLTATAADLRSSADRDFMAYLAATLGLVGLAVLSGVAVSREIREQVGGEPADVVRLVQRIAGGDLAGYSKDDVANSTATGILRDVTEMAATLNTMLRGLGHISKSLNAASEELDKVAVGVTEGSQVMQDQANHVLDSTRRMETDIDAISASSSRNSVDLSVVSDMAAQTDSNLHTIAAAAEEANANLETVAAATEQTSTNMAQVDLAAKRTNENVDTVSESVQGISASFAEVQKLCENASHSSQRATQRAVGGREIMDKLSAAAQEIKSVVAVINQIAEQTNMLALNASIEAAGAGEAGKGFAVVANEVKELARQTGDSTRMISEKIQAIQSLTTEAASVTREITESISQIAQSNQEILHTVDEQSSTVEAIANSVGRASEETAEVTRLVEESSMGISDVTRNMSELSLAVSEVTKNVSEASRSTGEMTQNVSQVAEASSEISEKMTTTSKLSKTIASSMEEMKDAVGGISKMSGTVKSRSGEMRQLANQLVEMLARFRM